MEFELLLKIGGLLVTIFGLPKIWREVQQISDSRLKGDFAFAKEYTQAIQGDPHPMVVEVGFRAFQNGRLLNAPEILYLLSFAQPSRATRLFLKGRDHLIFVDRVPQGHASVGFNSKYLSEKKRVWLKRWYQASYFVLAFSALAPLVFATQLLATPSQALVVGVLPVVTLGGLAYIMLINYASLYAAEQFIELQQGKA